MVSVRQAFSAVYVAVGVPVYPIVNRLQSLWYVYSEADFAAGLTRHTDLQLTPRMVVFVGEALMIVPYRHLTGK